MKHGQMALIVDAHKAANDEEFATIAPVTHQNVAQNVPARRNGWDPFEVWRTRIKPREPVGSAER
jgi:hypothetical protein